MTALTTDTLRKETLASTAPLVKAQVKREAGKLMLYIDATGLHMVLDAMGVSCTDGKYDHRPASNCQIARDNKMSTELLLVKEPLVKRDLSPVYTTPPNMTQLRALVNSVHDVSRRILEHYHPVDIVANVHRKVAK